MLFIIGDEPKNYGKKGPVPTQFLEARGYVLP
jgi:hypothetical protein